MKRIVFKKKHTLEWENVPEPEITGNNQAIVRPIAVSRCDLDLPIVQGQTLFRSGIPIGHEFVAEIEETSPEISGVFPKGTKVIIPFQISCGLCPDCSSGHSKACTSVPFASHYGMGSSAKEFGGALSEKIFVPFAKQMLIPMPSDADPIALAAISDNIVESWKLVGQWLEKKPNSPVMVLGGFASSIGLYTASLAVGMGASEVLYLDDNQERLGIAESMGAHAVPYSVLPKSWEKKFPIVADCHGTKEGMDFSFRSISTEGIYGTPSIFWTNKLEIPYLELYNTGAVLKIGRVDSREHIPEILKKISEKKIQPEKVVTKTCSFEEAVDAWLEPATKLVVKMERT
ncbi:alcohol dehydrogenase [Leptospira gomenensis]|uniref:Alcohol dehydrogenase n=1 Tax=Leptospira gomenensis TaxID=2484974 RepID=A0A5F1YH54_9LEPT|nr:alcohol dehydrogenase catalytic domain-containing protein [Leptospira gomenensis]TGK37584.1 alcohol dehydrogenase [Leptospira gomenensis]TGK39409.1 alcohol dehydrogenase [Leptospira gomenensis]TGK43169.1 alcohol dehydrogenase [Leptospira gomenensis]TGK55002.1 alcohol dehydrogenase [Leptospira gomenensis]